MRQQSESLWAFLGVLVLLSAIIGGSSIGVATNFVPPTNSLVINAWRAGILCLYMAIPTLIETVINWNRVNYGSIFTLKNYSQILITLTTQIAWTTGLLYGSGRMIQAHVYVLNNTHGLFIVMINVLTGSGLLKAEAIGVLLSFSGVVAMIFDPSASRVDGNNGTLLDYWIVLGSALFGALYFILSGKNVNQFPMCMLLFFMSFHNFILCAIMAKASDYENVKVLSTDPVYGCFGFLNSETAFVALVPFGLLAAFCGSAGYVLCLLWYSPVVTSNSYLIEPFIAQALGCAIGID